MHTRRAVRSCTANGGAPRVTALHHARKSCAVHDARARLCKSQHDGMTGEHHARASPRERGGRLSWPITSCVRRPCPTLDRARRREVRSRASVVVACSIALAARVFLPILCVLACVVRSLELGNADSGEFVPSAPVAHRLVKRARLAGSCTPCEALPETLERRAFRVTETVLSKKSGVKQ
jgi:hypothetical protein